MIILSPILDIILIIAGIIMMYYTIHIGGKIGHNSLIYMAIGFFILGIAHIIETTLFWLIPNLHIEIHEIVHRIIVFVGFAFVIMGYSRLLKFVKS